MLHVVIKNHLTTFSYVLGVGNQIINLTPNHFLAINPRAPNSKWRMQAHFDIYILRPFLSYVKGPIWTNFTICTFVLDIQNTSKLQLLKWFLVGSTWDSPTFMGMCFNFKTFPNYSLCCGFLASPLLHLEACLISFISRRTFLLPFISHALKVVAFSPN